MKEEIINYIDSLPNRELRPGLILKKIGYRYVYFVNIWYSSKIERYYIVDIYEYIFEGKEWGDILN